VRAVACRSLEIDWKRVYMGRWSSRSSAPEAVRDGHPVALGGPKQRAVLAMLVLAGNEPISRDRLIDGVWGERPAASARL
jgi:DNA-binding winged helix-turn-helix (wHTH) protein